MPRIHLPNVTGCCTCDALGHACLEHEAQLESEDRERRLDRWVEALLGGRLRFLAHLMEEPGDARRWALVYDRWRELHHDNIVTAVTA